MTISEGYFPSVYYDLGHSPTFEWDREWQTTTTDSYGLVVRLNVVNCKDINIKEGEKGEGRLKTWLFT